VAEILDRITVGERIWSETATRPETAAAGDVVARRVASSIEALQAAETSLRAWRTRVLAVSDRVIGQAASVDAAEEKLRTAIAGEQASLFVPNQAPLWSRGLGARIRGELPRLPQAVVAYTESTAEYVERDPRPVVVQVLMAVLVMFVLGRFSARALQRLAGEQAAARAARLLERPYSIALLLVLIASPALHPLAPRRFIQLVALIALFPTARIVMHASERANLTVFAGLFVLLFLDRVGLAVQDLPALARATFLVTLAIALGLAFWFRRRARFAGLAPWIRRVADLATLGLALALLAEVGGWTNLAALVGRGIVAGALAGLYVYAITIALAALLAYGLASRTVQRSYLLARNTAALQRRAEAGLRWLGAGLWLYFLATAVGMRSAAAGALGRVLDAGVSVGALSLSIGGVLAFVLTLLVALVLARVVTGVLEEDVYPRTHLPRGVPYVLSTLVRYGFYSFGFLFALAAAGVQLGQVAIMLGGLGIGIGLGLQDLVKNFAAGLTLLLERRVHVGDALEMPSQGILGRVLSIGMRASVVRTWNGAEVVVPNADLISSAVTNWTLSDRLCRLEVAVGVAYGTDPEQVIALLLDAVGSHDQFLAEPAPQALFKGFGDSSLDFVVRAWTDQGYDNSLSLTSQLALAVHRALRDAGIEIPFPQRDLHLASVSPSARAALSGVDRAERGAPRMGNEE
jgi:small-conductance mechanosensitive channel